MQQEVLVIVYWTTATADSSTNASHCSSPALHSYDVPGIVCVDAVHCLVAGHLCIFVAMKERPW